MVQCTGTGRKPLPAYYCGPEDGVHEPEPANGHESAVSFARDATSHELDAMALGGEGSGCAACAWQSAGSTSHETWHTEDTTVPLATRSLKQGQSASRSDAQKPSFTWRTGPFGTIVAQSVPIAAITPSASSTHPAPPGDRGGGDLQIQHPVSGRAPRVIEP